jgi:hypothetical protein
MSMRPAAQDSAKFFDFGLPLKDWRLNAYPNAASDTLPPMADAFLLSIDLNVIQNNFANCGEPMSWEAVETWLREMGFKRTDDGWIVEELSLTSLDWSEFRILKRL